jgi:hypothetical protein
MDTEIGRPLASSPTGISNKLPSLFHIILLSPSCPGLACSHGACTRPLPSSSTHSAQDRHTQTSTHNWRRRGRDRERDTPILHYTHARTYPRTHALTLNCHCPLFTATCIASPGLSRCRCRCRCTPLAHFVFSRRIPSSRVNTHSSTCALPAPVQHENNRRRLSTLRGNPLAMHSSGTHTQHPSLGRS